MIPRRFDRLSPTSGYMTTVALAPLILGLRYQVMGWGGITNHTSPPCQHSRVPIFKCRSGIVPLTQRVPSTRSGERSDLPRPNRGGTVRV